MTVSMKCHYSTICPNELLNKVLPEYCIDNLVDCVFWERGANDTYQVRGAGTRFYLRVFRHDAYPRSAVEFEADALTHLNQQGFPVAYPIPTRSGGYLTEVTAPEGQRYILVTSAAAGTTPDYELVDNSRAVGKSVARMHSAFDGFTTRHTRPALDLRSLLDDSLSIIQPYVAHRPGDLDFIEYLARETRDSVLTVPERFLDVGVCHGDLHGGNLHLHEGKITHFDFEECAFGFRVYDLATFKWDICTGKEGTDRWSAFMEGYESVRAMSNEDLSLVDCFVIIRDFSNIAYGLKHQQYFGAELSSDSSIDYFVRQLKKFQKVAFQQTIQ